MVFKRIELTSSELSQEALEEVLADFDVSDLHISERSEGMLRAILIVDDLVTEPVIDALSDRFESCDDFQLLVFKIEARLPRKTEEEHKKTKKDQSGDRISREELLADLGPGSRVHWIYLSQVFISCVVAAVGMMRDSVEMVIAAMVIAPLLIPSMSLALGTTIGDLKMMIRSVLTTSAGIALGLAVALCIGLIVPFDPEVNQIALRSQVRYSDLIVAIAAGAAGAIAVTTGVSASLIGVMVAVALVPPLVAMGLFLGSGYYTAAASATLLLASNVVCVNLAAVCIFLIQGIRPNRWSEKGRAKLAVRRALIIWIVLLTTLILLIAYAAPESPL